MVGGWWGGKVGEVGRKVRWQGGKSGEKGEVARWQGGKGGEREVRSQGGKGGESGEVAIKWERRGREVRWQGGKGGGERWGGKVVKVRWQGGKGGEERWGGKVGGSWFYSRVGDAGWVQDFIFLFLMLINRRKGQDGFWFFLRGRRVGKTLLKFNANR